MWGRIWGCGWGKGLVGRVLIRGSGVGSGGSMLKRGFMKFNGLEKGGRLFYIKEMVE